MVGVLRAIDEEHDAEALEPDGGSCEGDCAAHVVQRGGGLGNPCHEMCDALAPWRVTEKQQLRMVLQGARCRGRAPAPSTAPAASPP